MFFLRVEICSIDFAQLSNHNGDGVQRGTLFNGTSVEEVVENTAISSFWQVAACETNVT